MVGRLRTVRQVRAGAYLHSRRGADSGEISLYVTPEEYWLFTSVPAERKLRQAAIARHGGDVWAAVRELARGDAPPGGGARRADPDRGGTGMKLAVGALVAVLLVPLLLLAVAAAGVAALARTLNPLGHLPGLPGSGPLGPFVQAVGQVYYASTASLSGGDDAITRYRSTTSASAPPTPRASSA